MRKQRTLKKSIHFSYSVITGASTVASILGYAVKDICPQWQWWKCGLLVFCALVLISLIAYFVMKVTIHKPYTTTINGKVVEIKTGDIFKVTGWKIIPFNERYDTQVDDIILAHNSLNGKMIDFYADDLSELNCIIAEAAHGTSKLEPTMCGGKPVFPLGKLIPYKDFLMLSFSHVNDQNQAYLGIGEYEQLLLRMWQELRNIYAAKHIAIPFLGTGITTIEGVSEKNYTEMLKCILCTLRASTFQPDQGISIILTQEALEKIDMNIIKEEF